MSHILVHVEYDKHGNVLSRQWMDDSIGSHNQVKHPSEPTRAIPHHEFLGLCNSDRALIDSAGYSVASSFEGEEIPKTIWQRIVAHCNNPDAPRHLQDLKLKE